MMLATASLLTSAPVLFTVLVLTVALFALRAVSGEQGVHLTRRLSLVLDRTILVALLLVGVLVVARFESLA
jgi:hypothetical protein